jgi:Family of unknown function (DUF5709)
MSVNRNEQLQPEETLVDRGVEDMLDEGVSPPEKLRGADAKSTTPRGELEGETIDERLEQEEPDPLQTLSYDAEDPDDLAPAEEDEFLDDGEVGNERSGRLVAPDGGVAQDVDAELVAEDAGISGGAASAEEAAMHTIEEPGDDRL